MGLARILGGIGRVMITAGVLILLFVAYQLWGTGLQAAQAQDRLDSDFDRQAEQFAERRPELADAKRAQLPIPKAPGTGDVIGRIQIPAINVDWKFVQGVGLDVLQDGPGHYEGTSLPGQQGNAAIAGHRTTYGQPFHRLDELDDGDRIVVTYFNTARAVYEYRNTEIVTPDRVDVLEDKGDDRLTLTACHPKYSAAERIVVTAALIGRAREAPAPAPDAPEVELNVESIDGEDADNTPAVLWGLAAAMIWLTFWLIGRVWRRLPAYVVGTPLFLVALFIFFENFSRLLPAAY